MHKCAVCNVSVYTVFCVDLLFVDIVYAQKILGMLYWSLVPTSN